MVREWREVWWGSGGVGGMVGEWRGGRYGEGVEGWGGGHEHDAMSALSIPCITDSKHGIVAFR